MSEQSEKKRLEELRLFRQMQRIDPSLPQSEAFAADKPDIRVPYDGGVIGVEMTRLFFQQSRPGRPLQEQDRLKVQLAARAKHYFAQTGLPPRAARPVFRVGATLNKHQLDQHARAFATAVALADVSSLKPRRFARSEVPELPDVISAFYGRECYPGEDPQWLNGVSGRVHEISPEDLARAIGTKECKLFGYDQDLDEFWLVLALSGFTAAAIAELSPFAATASYRSAFERVYFYDAFEGRVVRLDLFGLRDTA